MKISKITIGLCVATLIAFTSQAQYNSNAGRNEVYENVEVEEEVLDSDGEVMKDSSGEIIYETKIVEQKVSTDDFGNAEGNNYDLALDGAFDGNTIVVINLVGNTMQYAKSAVAEKGLTMVEWKAPPAPEVLKEKLELASQLWVLSGSTLRLTEAHLDVIEEFFDSGKGLYIWGDNDPLYADANFITERLFGTTMGGDTYADQVVGISGEGMNRTGIVDGHLIATGVANVYEGITIATVKATQDLSPLIYNSSNELVAAIYEKDGKRAIIDGGFTRLSYKWGQTAGTERYIKNAAAWLVNYERFGDLVYEADKTDENAEKKADEKKSEKKDKKSDDEKDLGLLNNDVLLMPEYRIKQ